MLDVVQQDDSHDGKSAQSVNGQDSFVGTQKFVSHIISVWMILVN